MRPRSCPALRLPARERQLVDITRGGDSERKLLELLKRCSVVDALRGQLALTTLAQCVGAPMLVDVRSRSMTIKVRVFRERSTLLSRLAHDVELSLTRFDVEESENNVEVEFEPGSLVVEGALSDGVVDLSILKAPDHSEIERNLRELLKTRMYPKGRFTGSFQQEVDSVLLRGALELLGERRDVAWELTRRGDRFVGSLVLEPSRWGIAPYRALLGALKLQDRVEVRMEVAADRGPS